MLKFMVVLYRRPDFSPAEFRRFLQEVHGPLARKIPGLRRYRQNHFVDDPKRKHPGWDAIVELYFDDWRAMETAWDTPEGKAATEDLEKFADLGKTSWSVVEELIGG